VTDFLSAKPNNFKPQYQLQPRPTVGKVITVMALAHQPQDINAADQQLWDVGKQKCCYSSCWNPLK
jgi:hypothetical protein